MRSQTGSVADGIQPWHASPSGQRRLEQEIAQLRAHYSQPEVAVKDGADGNTNFIIKTPSLPGQTYYIKTTPRFPHEPPVMMLEKDGEGLAVGSRVLTNWQPTTWLAEVIDELVGNRVRVKVFMLGGLAFGAIVLIAAVGFILFLSGQGRLNRADAIATAGALSTEVAQNYDDLQTLQATATAAALLNPAIANQPDPTLAAAEARLKQLRDRNNQALATVTALAQRDATITAQAVQQSNQQTQGAYQAQLTSDAQGQQTATAIANQITNQPAPTVWVQPAPTPIGRRPAPPQAAPTPTAAPAGQPASPTAAPVAQPTAPEATPTVGQGDPNSPVPPTPAPPSQPGSGSTVAPVPTPTSASVPTPTAVQPGVTPVPPTATPVSQPQAPATPTPQPRATATPRPTPTPVMPATPASAPTPTSVPRQPATATPVPVQATATPGSTPVATATPGTTSTATATPGPTVAPTATPRPPTPTPFITIPPLPTLSITLPPILPHSIRPAQPGEFSSSHFKELSI